MTAVALVAFAIGVPAAAFALWPLVSRRARGRAFLPVPPDPREQLLEQKRQILRALRELSFEHEAGHVSDDDYADLRARYEAEAAATLAQLDRLGPPPEPPAPPRPSAAPRRGWRHPLALAASAAALVVFGVGLGAGIVRYTTPEQPMSGMPMPASPLLSPPEAPPMVGAGPRAPGGGAGTTPAGPRSVTPEVLNGMLRAARSSLFEGRYTEAIAAYQAVLKRDPNNVDALTHLGLIVAMGGHIDTALQTFDRALAIDPNYPPALLYRGQALWEGKRDVEGAIRSWQKFLRVVPAGEDHERVKRLIAEARRGR